MFNNTLKALFLDIGGVILTNGWDRHARKRAIDHFQLEKDELNERHHLTFDTYEEGKLTLDEYLNRVIFYREREFSKEEFIQFMVSQSQKLGNNLEFFIHLKKKYNWKIVAISNEGRELNDYRIQTFGLNRLFDVYISSSFVHFRKPDADMFNMACDIAQIAASEALYIDDRQMFVEVAQNLGLHGIHFTGLENLKESFRPLGYEIDFKDLKIQVPNE